MLRIIKNIRRKMAVLTNVRTDNKRRNFLTSLLAGAGGLLALNGVAKASDAADDDKELRFPGDPAEHKVVYQFNKSDSKYHNSVLFSVGAVLRKYGDNVQIVVVGIGTGIHILAKKPERPVSDEIKQRVASLMQYGIKFHACGNTMKSLEWTKKDIIDGVEIVEVGAADLIELQAAGYSYISW
ncbi:MAG: DsrE family protein [Thiohalomonadales bacterium]